MESAYNLALRLTGENECAVSVLEVEQIIEARDKTLRKECADRADEYINSHLTYAEKVFYGKPDELRAIIENDHY